MIVFNQLFLLLRNSGVTRSIQTMMMTTSLMMMQMMMMMLVMMVVATICGKRLLVHEVWVGVCVNIFERKFSR